MDARRSRCIQPAQNPMQKPRSAAVHSLSQAFAQCFVTDRHRAQPIQQRPQIQPRPAGDDGHAPSRGNLTDSGTGSPSVIACGVLDAWRNNVDQVMWDASALLTAGFGGAQLHLPVDRDGVARDDFPTKSLRQPQGESRLARARGSHQDGKERIGLAHRCRHHPGGKTLCTPARSTMTINTTSPSSNAPPTCSLRSSANCRSRMSVCCCSGLLRILYIFVDAELNP